MVWVIAFGELFFGDLWCVVWGYGGMRTHFSLLNPYVVGSATATLVDSATATRTARNRGIARIAAFSPAAGMTCADMCGIRQYRTCSGTGGR